MKKDNLLLNFLLIIIVLNVLYLNQWVKDYIIIVLNLKEKLFLLVEVQEYFLSVILLIFYSKEPNICKVVILHKLWLIKIH